MIFEFKKSMLPSGVALVYIILEIVATAYYARLFYRLGLSVFDYFSFTDTITLTFQNMEITNLVLLTLLPLSLLVIVAVFGKSKVATNLFTFCLILAPFVVGGIMQAIANANADYIRKGKRSIFSTFENKSETKITLSDSSTYSSLFQIASSSQYWLFFSKETHEVIAIKKDRVIEIKSQLVRK